MPLSPYNDIITEKMTERLTVLKDTKHVQIVSKATDLEAQFRESRDHHGPSKTSRHGADDSASAASLPYVWWKSNLLVICLIICLGSVTCGAFLAVGISSAVEDQRDHFDRRADDLVNRIQRSWEDYSIAAAWTHGRCRGRNFTRADFRVAYEYLINAGLKFQALQFDPNITNEERPSFEAAARSFYEENYPSVEYHGFKGFNFDNSSTLEPRLEADFYFPIHYMEPVLGNERAIDLDYHASGSRRQTVLFSMHHGQPALTDRLVLVQEISTESAFGVVLMHPGYALDSSAGASNEVWPRDLASIVIRIPDLLRRAAEDTGVSLAAYIYDASEYSGGPPRFLGGAEIRMGKGENWGEPMLVFLHEIELEVLRGYSILSQESVVKAANKDWIVVVHVIDDSFDPDIFFVLFAGVVIFLASVGLAYWVYANSKRVDAFNRMKQEADTERASLVLESARQAAKAERELNDFIAHEVSIVS